MTAIPTLPFTALDLTHADRSQPSPMLTVANPPPELTGEKRISGDKVHPDTSAKPKKPKKKNTFIVEVSERGINTNNQLLTHPHPF